MPNFTLKYAPFWVFVLIIGDFSPNYSELSKAWECFGKSARPIVSFWEKELVTKVKFMGKVFIYFWCVPKRHAICGIHTKLQFGFPKMADFRAKLDERQGKNQWLRSKLSADLRNLIFLDYFSHSLRKVTMKSWCDIYIASSWANHKVVF